MSSVRYHLFVPKITPSNVGAVKNDGGVPSILSGLDDSKPAAGVVGRLYIATDTKYIYRDNGTTWELLASNALTAGSYPVWSPGALPPSEIIDQIVVMPAEEVQNRVYNFIPLTMKSSTTDSSLSNVIDFRVRGNYLYLVTGSALIIFDISNASSPIMVSNTNFDAYLGLRSMDIQGFYLYVSDSSYTKILRYDISDVSLPTLSYSFNIGYIIHDFKIIGNYLYCLVHKNSSVRQERFLLYDISVEPYVKKIDIDVSGGYYAIDSIPGIVNVKGNYAITVHWRSGYYLQLSAVDVSNKDYPIVYSRSTGAWTDDTSAYKSSYIQGNYWYIWDGDGLYIFDISNPSLLSTMPTVGVFFPGNFGIARPLGCKSYVYYNYAYFVTNAVSPNGTLFVVDISNPSSMSIIKSITGLPLYLSRLIRVYGNYLYIITDNNKLLIYG